MVKGGTNGFALKAGDAASGVLPTMYDGPRPNGYQPMKKVRACAWVGCGGWLATAPGHAYRH
jgi:non-reducing end alpha-L-arabinofuranosidase